MTKTLHILNGDSTAQIFSKSFLQGDIIVWREMLCEGPVHNNVGSDDFWTTRYKFYEHEIGVNKLEYYDTTIKEIVKIQEVSNYDDVVLWFEYDLFCQINLLALCSYLLKYYTKNIKYSLVCTGKEDGKKELQTLSNYSPNEYKNLLKNKVTLSRNNLLFAEECWNLYVENDKENLTAFNFDHCKKFKYLKLAIHQHLQRFPGKNGLNQIENKILNLIHSGITNKNSIVKELLLWQQKETFYGFGDLQYYMALNKLDKYYIIENDVITLNTKGNEMLKL